MDLFTLVAKLVLDSSDFESGIKKNQGLFSALGSKVGAGAVAMGNLVSTGISKAAGAVFDFGKESLQTGIDFEAAMDKVAAISGTTGTKFDDLVDKAMEMGAVTKFSATESAEAFQYMAMAGWDADQMMAGISGVMDLAAASGENLGTVSDIVTDVLTAMGKSAGDAGHFADVLAAASSSANTNVGMMGETFKYAAPIAGALGYSIEDLALATGLMANAGIKGGQAGTGLRAMLTRLAKPTKDSQKAMNKLGISLENSNGSMKSLREIMNDMRGSFEGLTESQQAEYAALLAGQEAMSGLLAIVNASDDDFNKLIENIDNSKDAAKTMAEIMMDNVAGSLEQLGGAMETLGLLIFDKFKEPIKNAIDVVAGFADTLGQAFQENGFAGMAKAGGDAIKAFVDGLTDVGEGSENGQSLAAAAGNAIASFVGYLSDLAPDLAGAAGTLLGSLAVGLGEAAPEILMSANDAIGEALIALLNSAFSANLPDWETLKTNLVDGLTNVFEELGAFFEGDDNAGLIAGWFETIKTNIDEALLGLMEFLGIEVSEDFTGPISSLATWWESIAANIANGLVSFSSFIKTKIPSEFTKPIETIKGYFETIASKLSSALGDLGNFVKTIVPQGLLNAFDKIRAVWEAIKDAIEAALAALEDFLKKDKTKVEINSSGAVGSFAVGLDYVPYDNYSANLHRGEAVLTRQEAEEWRAGNGGRGGTNITVNQTIYSEAKTAADLMREARWEQERGVLMAYV